MTRRAERVRWHATRFAGLPTVQARTLTLSDQTAAEHFALVTAIRRRRLSHSDEAAAYRRLLALGLSREDAAFLVGFSRGHVTYSLQLLDLPAGVIRLVDLVDLGAIKLKHVRSLHRFAAYPRVVTYLAAQTILNRRTAADLARLHPEDPHSLQAAGLVLSGAEAPDASALLRSQEHHWHQKRAAAALAAEIDSWTDVGALSPETATAVATDLVLRAGPTSTLAAVTRQLPDRAAQAAALAGRTPRRRHPHRRHLVPLPPRARPREPPPPLKIAIEAHRLHSLASPLT